MFGVDDRHAGGAVAQATRPAGDVCDIEHGIYWASMSQGLIHDIPTVKELIDRIIGEAEAIINQRLRAALGA